MRIAGATSSASVRDVPVVPAHVRYEPTTTPLGYTVQLRPRPKKE